MRFHHSRPVSALLIVIALCVLGFGAGVAGCGSGGSGADIPLRHAYHAGDTWVQEVSTEASGTTQGVGDATVQQTTETTKSRVTSTVQSVNAEGVATIKVTTEALEIVVDGASQDQGGPEPRTVTITVNPAGKVLSTQTENAGSAAAAGLMGGLLDPSDLGNQLGALVYPAGGMAKVGAEWTSVSSIPLTGLDQELKVNTRAKLTGVATEGGKQTAGIDYTTSLPMDTVLDLGRLLSAFPSAAEEGGSSVVFKMSLKGTISVTGTAKIDTATGDVTFTDAGGTMNVTMKVTDAPESMIPAGQRGPYTSNMTLKMTITRVQ